jgi:glycosyltransferase involved in cell wall biosynthesis
MGQSDKVKIMFISSSWPPVSGGVSDYTQKFAESLALQGARLEVITSAEFKIEKTIGNPKVMPLVRRWHRNNFWQLLLPILSFRPHWIILQYPTEIPGKDSSLTPWVAVLSKLAFPWIHVAYIVHEYSETLEANKPALRRAFTKADKIFAFSPADIAELKQDRFNPNELRIGSNIGYWKIKEISSAKRYLVFFGLQDDKKDLVSLFLAVKRVPGLTLRMIGPINPTYQDCPEAKALKGNIEWLGKLPEQEVSWQFQGAIAAVFPFISGIKPNNASVLAAIVNNCPVIATEGPNTPVALRDCDGVILIPDNSVETLAKAFRAIEANQQGKPTELATVYSWNKIAEEFLIQLAE